MAEPFRSMWPWIKPATPPTTFIQLCAAMNGLNFVENTDVALNEDLEKGNITAIIKIEKE